MIFKRLALIDFCFIFCNKNYDDDTRLPKEYGRIYLLQSSAFGILLTKYIALPKLPGDL